jgi:hypothetical protein
MAPLQGAFVTTSLDLKYVIQQKMQRNGIPAARLADASGYTTSDLSRWFNGKLVLSNDQAKFIYSKVIEIEKLIAAVYPLPIDFRRGDAIRHILTKISDKELEFSVKNPASVSVPLAPVGGLMALSGMGTFQTFQGACSAEITDRVNRMLNGKATYQSKGEIRNECY